MSIKKESKPTYKNMVFAKDDIEQENEDLLKTKQDKKFGTYEEVISKLNKKVDTPESTISTSTKMFLSDLITTMGPLTSDIVEQYSMKGIANTLSLSAVLDCFENSINVPYRIEFDTYTNSTDDEDTDL
jgi:hypothetical protein